MLKRKQAKKKKAFTLIELVIVLAVLAIIALIAIPNFTKVRNDSKAKADLRSAEQIEKITLMAIADKKVKAGDTYTLQFKDDKTFDTASGADQDYLLMLKDVKKPQVNEKSTFHVKVGSKGDVQIRYADGDKDILAGPTTLAE